MRVRLGDDQTSEGEISRMGHLQRVQIPVLGQVLLSSWQQG